MLYYAAAAALFGLAASVSAGNIHAHHAKLHQRSIGSYAPVAPVEPEPANKTCGCTTYTITWYGEPTLSPLKPTSIYVPPPPATTTSESKPSTYEKPSKPTYEAPAPKPEAPKAPAPKPEAPKAPATYDTANKSGGGKGGYSPISPNGNQWAMAYTPYAQDGSCKSADVVIKDIGSIKGKGFTTVRIYATDCSGLENVGAAAKQHGMKLIVGIYIDGAGLGKGYEQIGQIASWGKANWGMVEMVVAGNEAVFNGFCSASDLAGFIGNVKSQLKDAGYNGPVTTTEPLNTIQEYAGIFCPVVDVIAANIHPFFNGGYSASQAGDFVAKQMEDLAAVCDHKKEACNLETGWPRHGRPNNAAKPGDLEQQQAIVSIVSKVGSKSVIFSYDDDNWKAPGDFDVEQYWGCSKLFSG